MDTPLIDFAIYNENVAYTKGDGTYATISVPMFELPAGTLLFRGVQLPNPQKDEDPRMFLRDWLGYPKGDRFCLPPTQNTFFYTTPFVPFGAHTVGEWFNGIMIYQLVKDVRVVTMISPSKWVRGGKEIKALDGTAPIQRCDKLDYSCITDKTSAAAKLEKQQKSWDNCIHPDFAQGKKVSGWMAIADYDSLDNFKEGLKGKETTMGKYIMELESRLPGKGIDLLTSTYTDDSGHRGFPEVVLYPWAPHPGTENQYTEARTEEDAADAIAEMSDRFTYLPIACITERGVLEAFTGDFKASDLPAYASRAAPGALTRKNIDKLQADYLEKLQKGVTIPGFGPCKLLFDARTGFYVMDRFSGSIIVDAGVIPYKKICLPLSTPEEKELVEQYKIRYRSFDRTKFRATDTFVDGETTVPRLFVFERPDELYKQYKELGLRLPSRFIPYIWAATEVFQKNLANRKQKEDPRGAEEARRRAAEAKQKIQESLQFIAKKKEERETKKTGKAATVRATPAQVKAVVKAEAEAEAEKEEEELAAPAAFEGRTPPFVPTSPPYAPGTSVTPPFYPSSPPYVPGASVTPPFYPSPPLPAPQASTTPPFAPSTPDYAPETQSMTGIQRTIPILKTYDEAFVIGMEALQSRDFPKHYPLGVGANPFTSGSWEINEKSLKTTLNYIYNFMHHTCYMLCIKEGTPYLYKLEGGGLPDTVRDVLQREIAEKGITDIDLNKTRVMQCIIKPYQEQTTTATEWLTLLQELKREGYKLPNGIFILNLTDALMLREDQNEPFGFFTKSLVKLPKQYVNKYWLPILSYSGNRAYDDIAIPNYDDLFEIKRKADGSVDEEATMGGAFEVDWSKKLQRAVFRGGTTGCGYTANTNQRIQLTSPEFLNSMREEEILDVGITTITKQYKMDIEKGLGRVDPRSVTIRSPLPMTAQSKYKYILHVDGNVFAYRFLKTMLTGSCILRVESMYNGWMDKDKSFAHRGFDIKEDTLSTLANKCFIWVNPSLDDLDDVLEWCVEHDDACKTIAKNGREYALRILSKQYIYGSLVNTLNACVDTAMSGGAVITKQKQTRKQTQKKGSNKKTRKQKKQTRGDPLVLAEYRKEDPSPFMKDYIQSTMKNLWQTFAKRTKSAF